MVRFNEINEHFQLNRIQYETFKRTTQKKMAILKHKFVWYFDCHKENLIYDNPTFMEGNFHFPFTIIFYYDDPTNNKPIEEKKLFFTLAFLPPEGNRIRFNDKIFVYNDTLEELFEELLTTIKKDDTIYGI